MREHFNERCVVTIFLFLLFSFSVSQFFLFSVCFLLSVCPSLFLYLCLFDLVRAGSQESERLKRNDLRFHASNGVDRSNGVPEATDQTFNDV